MVKVIITIHNDRFIRFEYAGEKNENILRLSSLRNRLMQITPYCGSKQKNEIAMRNKNRKKQRRLPIR